MSQGEIYHEHLMLKIANAHTCKEVDELRNEVKLLKSALASSQNPLYRPAANKLSVCLKELRFGRPRRAQILLDKFIAETVIFEDNESSEFK